MFPYPSPWVECPNQIRVRNSVFFFFFFFFGGGDNAFVLREGITLFSKKDAVFSSGDDLGSFFGMGKV